MRTLSTVLCLSALIACDDTTEPTTTPDVEAVPFQAAAAPTSTPGGSMEPGAVVASWQGGQITYGELESKIRNQVIQMEVEYLTNRYSTESNTLDQMMVEILLEEEATARGMDGPEALLREEVEAKVGAPTEAEIVAFYEVVKRQARNAPLEQIRDQVVGELMRRKQSERAQEYIAELKAKRGGTTSLPFPELPRIEIGIDDDPMLGSPDAQVTIVQFAEYQCPYCGQANEVVEQVLKDYEGQVRMVYRDFPLSFHPRAIPAAVAANCAGEQDQYWEMHRLLMSNQRALEESDLLAHAQALELDLDKWSTCRLDPAQEKEVVDDMEAGAAAGVSGTPAFFINGIMLGGALPYEQFKEIIDRELSRG
ncbi:MAG: protein-disulfide isomerase [Myxococcota bacterium]|jgi:protein-disulfide isomerase